MTQARTTSKAQQREESARLLRQARYGKRRVKVTRCPPGAREWDSKSTKRGGTTPSHLDPVMLQLTLTDDEHATNARLDRISRSIWS